jgi:putative ubiquitin-RnfH superfamily antitoxin RatB of RatAB toxin-antitoxin module
MAELRVQVCYAKQDTQFLRELTLADGSSVRDAIECSGVLLWAPELDPLLAKVGVFGKLKTLDTRLRDGDRVEVYRPLLADPKESRRKRAIKKEQVRTR